MLSEIEIDASDKYLVCNCSVSNKELEDLKLGVIGFMSKREKDDLYFEFIDWQKKYNEIIVLTMYAYADIVLPKKFDTIFQIDNPNNFIATEFLIIHVILNGWTAVNEISHGHKHFAVLQFKDSIPKIFELLPKFNKAWVFKTKIELGFCNKNDFEAIKNKLLNK